MAFLLLRGAVRAVGNLFVRGKVPASRSTATASASPPPPRETVEVIYVKEPEMAEYHCKVRIDDFLNPQP
jgi:hypothetical protein